MRLHGRREGVMPSRPTKVAFSLAIRHGMTLPPDAWLLVAMARGLYWLRPSAWEEDGWRGPELHQLQDHIMAAFIRVEAQATAQLAAAEVEVQKNSSSQTIKEGSRGAGSSDTAAGLWEERERVSRELSSFLWAVFSNLDWCRRTTAEQRAALCALIVQQPVESAHSQHLPNILLALVRLKVFVGPEAVAPFLASGVVARSVSEPAQQSLQEDPRSTRDALLSIGRLEYQAEPAQLAALLEQLLHLLQQGAEKGSGFQLSMIAEALVGVLDLYYRFPQKYSQLLQHPAVAELACMFSRELDLTQVRDRKAWAGLVQACGEAGYDAPVGQGGQGLLELATTQLPFVATVASPYECTQLLLGLGAFFGVPDGGQLAPALQPYRSELVLMARCAKGRLSRYHDKTGWKAKTSWEQQQQLVRAFAAC